MNTFLMKKTCDFSKLYVTLTKTVSLIKELCALRPRITGNRSKTFIRDRRVNRKTWNRSHGDGGRINLSTLESPLRIMRCTFQKKVKTANRIFLSTDTHSDKARTDFINVSAKLFVRDPEIEKFSSTLSLSESFIWYCKLNIRIIIVLALTQIVYSRFSLRISCFSFKKIFITGLPRVWIAINKFSRVDKILMLF